MQRTGIVQVSVNYNVHSAKKPQIQKTNKQTREQVRTGKFAAKSFSLSRTRSYEFLHLLPSAFFVSHSSNDPWQSASHMGGPYGNCVSLAVISCVPYFVYRTVRGHGLHTGLIKEEHVGGVFTSEPESACMHD